MLNICFVYKHGPYQENKKNSGIGNYVNSISTQLAETNNVYVVTETNHTGSYLHANYTVISLKRLIIFEKFNKRIINVLINNLRVAFTLLKLHISKKLDIIEFANWEAEGLIFSLISYLFKLKPVIVCRIHTGTLDNDIQNNSRTFISNVLHYLEGIFLKLPNVNLITSTIQHSKRYRKIHNLGQKQIKIITLGIPQPKQTNFDKTKQVKNPDRFLSILFVGRSEKRKGIDTLVKAMPIVLERNQNVVFTIICDGSIDVLSEIHRIVPYQYLNRVNFHGYVNQPRIIQYFYQSATICVFPSRYESFGYTIAEAMSYGKAVVTTNVGGIPQLVKHNQNGILIKPNNSNLLANTLLDLIKDRKRRKALEINARETILNAYSTETFTQHTIDYFNYLVKSITS